MDEPPRSDAGQDVVIQLPTDWAVLDGRDSLDDHGIARYEWTLVRGDTAITMKVGLEYLSLGHVIDSEKCSMITTTNDSLIIRSILWSILCHRCFYTTLFITLLCNK